MFISLLSKPGLALVMEKILFSMFLPIIILQKVILPFQKNSLTSVGAAATYKTLNNHEWNAKLGFSSDDYFLYGFEPDNSAIFKTAIETTFPDHRRKVAFPQYSFQQNSGFLIIPPCG